MDTNYYLLGFDDCVLDIKTREFRKRKPSDMITMTCGYNFMNFKPD